MTIAYSAPIHKLLEINVISARTQTPSLMISLRNPTFHFSPVLAFPSSAVGRRAGDYSYITVVHGVHACFRP